MCMKVQGRLMQMHFKDFTKKKKLDTFLTEWYIDRSNNQLMKRCFILTSNNSLTCSNFYNIFFINYKAGFKETFSGPLTFKKDCIAHKYVSKEKSPQPSLQPTNSGQAAAG